VSLFLSSLFFFIERILKWIWTLRKYFPLKILKELLNFLILHRIAFYSQQNCRFVPTVSFTNGPVFQYYFTYIGLSGTHQGGFLVEIPFKMRLSFVWGSKFCMFLLWWEIEVNISAKKTTKIYLISPFSLRLFNFYLKNSNINNKNIYI